ncbi:MAG: BfmA/BtgA family mobilization protein [Bacteroidota bacterium]
MKGNVKRYDYSAISIKADVAVLFRRYCRTFGKTNSEVLQQMVLFLKFTGLDPFKNHLGKLVKLQEKALERIEYTIALIKNIEKTQTKPTYEMTKILFEAYVRNKPESEGEERVPIREAQILMVPQSKLYYVKEGFKAYKKRCQYLLTKVEVVEPTFGKPYLRLDLTQEEFERLSKELQ